MELAWLEDFLALSSTGIFARAATARNISQPAFTRRIQKLEYWIGTPLVDRSVHPIKLTPAGEAFKITAVDVIRTLEFAKDEALGMSSRKEEVIEIVALHTLAISYFPVWIAATEKSLGPVKVRIRAESYSSCAEALLSGSSDFMLGYHHDVMPMIMDDDRHTSIKLADDKLIAVCVPNNSGAPLFDLNYATPFPYLAHTPESVLGRITNSILENSGLSEYAEFRYENSVSEALKIACLNGLGVAWLPTICVKEEIEKGELVHIKNKQFETSLSVKLHRSTARSRGEVERLWSLVASDTLY